MTRFAGLEIQRDLLRLAIFDGSPKKFTLVDFVEEAIEGESEVERHEAVRAILSEVMGRKENRGMDFVSCLDSKLTILREISVPFTRDDQIAKTVRFEAETYIHAHTIDDVIIEYLKCAEGETSSRLLICAAPKDHLAEHLDGLRQHKIDPSIVELDATALATAFANTPMYAEDQNVLIVQVDEGSTRLVFLEQGKVVKIRSVWATSGASTRFGDGAATSVSRASVLDDGRSGETRPSSRENGTESRKTENRKTEHRKTEHRKMTGGSETPGPRGVSDEIARRFEAIEKSLEDLDQDDEPAEDVPFVVLSDEDYATIRGSGAEREEKSSAFFEEEGGGAGTVSSSTGGAGPSEAAPTAGEGALIETSAARTGTAVEEQDDTSEENEPDAVSAAANVLARFGASDPVGRLILEIERTFAAYMLGNSIDLVVVAGSNAERLDVVSKLRDHFEVDVTQFDLGDSFPIVWEGDSETISRHGAVACGLGLRALGLGATTFDLRKDEFRFERRFARMMPSLTLVGLLFAVFTLLWSFHGWRQLVMLNTETSVLKQSQQQLCHAFFGEERISNAPDPNWLQAAKNRLATIQGKKKRQGARLKTYESPMKMLNDFMNAVDLASPKVYPRFTSFDLDALVNNSSKSSVTFEVDDISEYQRIKASLEANSEYFEVSGTTKDLKEAGYEGKLELRFKDKIVGEKKR